MPIPPAAPVTRTVRIAPSRCIKQKGWGSFLADLGCQLLVALSAVGQMPPHGCACLRGRSGADGAEDVPVLLLETPQVGAVVRPVRRIHVDRLAGNAATAALV